MACAIIHRVLVLMIGSFAFMLYTYTRGRNFGFGYRTSCFVVKKCEKRKLYPRIVALVAIQLSEVLIHRKEKKEWKKGSKKIRLDWLC